MRLVPKSLLDRLPRLAAAAFLLAVPSVAAAPPPDAPIANAPETTVTAMQCKERPKFEFRSISPTTVELTATSPVEARYSLEVLPTGLYCRPLVGGTTCEMRVSGRSPRSEAFQTTTGQTVCVPAPSQRGRVGESGLPAGAAEVECHASISQWALGADSRSIQLEIERAPLLRISGGTATIAYATEGYGTGECAAHNEGVVTVPLLDQHRISFDAGVVATLLGHGGDFEVKPEVAVTARSEWRSWLTGRLAVRYSQIGSKDESEDEEESPGDGEGTGATKETEDAASEEEQAFDPFSSGGGILDLGGDVTLKPWPRSAGWLGLTLGAGAASVPGDDDDADLELETRWRAGLSLEVNGFNAGRPGDALANSRGYLFLGYGDDKLWDAVDDDGTVLDGSKRWFLEAELEIPNVGTRSVRGVLRVWASVPKQDGGPSDVRVSVLASFDPRKWFGHANVD